MKPQYRFDRLEFAGSLGDLGTLLPLAIGMIMINGLDPSGIFLSVGLFYIVSGLYFGVTSPVQPMKVIGAYAVATAISPTQIAASGLLIGVLLIIIGGTGLMTVVGRLIPKPVVRGVQLSTGVLLMSQGVKFMIGTSKYQVMLKAAEPYLTLQSIGPLPFGILIGIAGFVVTLLLLDSKKLPAGLVVIIAGLGLGALIGTHQGFDALQFGFYLPVFLPFGLPDLPDISFALLVLVLPQIPMTLGNAVVANADLSAEYFGDDSKKVTYKSLCIGMGLANVMSFFLGGMPLCTGAGGLAAHYRFGARTPGSNIMIGAVFVFLAVFLGSHALAIVNLIPMAILGVLLVFAGGQLALTVIDLKERKELFVTVLILGITLAANLAVGFLVGIAVAYAFKSEKLNI